MILGFTLWWFMTQSPLSVPLHIHPVTRTNTGWVYCAVWQGPKGYPTKRKHAAYEARSRVKNRKAPMSINVTAHKEYAIACFHDENSNQKLDTNFLGIPSEGTGASNDARSRFGPPKYKKARMIVTSTTTVRITIR